MALYFTSMMIEQKIFDILNDYVQPKSNITAAAAAQSIDSLFPVNRQDSSKFYPVF